jgi:hypothetical protein
MQHLHQQAEDDDAGKQLLTVAANAGGTANGRNRPGGVRRQAAVAEHVVDDGLERPWGDDAECDFGRRQRSQGRYPAAERADVPPDPLVDRFYFVLQLVCLPAAGARPGATSA